MKYELTIGAINNLADNGFSGMLKIYDQNGKIIRRVGMSAATEAMVERLAEEYIKEKNLWDSSLLLQKIKL